MKRYVYDHALEKVIEVAERGFERRLHIISDNQEPLRHPVTGKVYSSKSRFRADTKAAGCEEVGNEKMVSTHSKPSAEQRRAVLRQELDRRGITDSKASEIMNSLARQVRR